jgi:hypothetical protein
MDLQCVVILVISRSCLLKSRRSIKLLRGLMNTSRVDERRASKSFHDYRNATCMPKEEEKSSDQVLYPS